MCYCTLNKLPRKQVTYFTFPNAIQSKDTINSPIKKSGTDINFGLYLHGKCKNILNLCIKSMCQYIWLKISQVF